MAIRQKTEVLVLSIMLFTAINLFGTEKAAMTATLQKAKADLSAVLAAIDKDLAAASKKLATMDLKNDEARKILSSLCRGRPYVYDCAIVDMDGKLSVIEPDIARKYEGEDISFEPQVKDFFKTRAPLVSKVFKALDGTMYIDFIYPILTDKGEAIGAFSLLVSHEKLLEGTLAPLVKDQSCKIWVMQTDGLVIYDPDPVQVNKNIFTDQMFREFADLISFAGIVAKEPSGAGSYSFYKKDLKDKAVLKDAVWDTVNMPANEWRIVVAGRERNQPIPKGTTP